MSTTVVIDFYNYLITPCTTTSQTEYEQTIDEHIARMQRRFCQNADVGYSLTSEILERREQLQRQKHNWRHNRKPSRSGVHGPQTKMMKQQLNAFAVFLKDHPIEEYSQLKTIGARANQFWACKVKTFGTAAKAQGEKRGYANAKAIASAYRTSKR